MFPGKVPGGSFQDFWSLFSLANLGPQSYPSALRSSALILEEIAIDCHNKETEERLLQEAHDLHLSSLQLAKKAFGEFNVQTAKHYGNLGRLYQSMRKFKVRCFARLSSPASVR